MTKDDAFRVALETADGILNSDWRNWQELSSPEEFERWVKARANHMAIALRQALAEPPKWVHLLPDEKEDIRKSVDYNQFMSAEEYACKVQDATEAKLKELNHD